MLSFCLSIGAPATRAAVEHRQDLVASLAQRSWRDAVPDTPLDDTRATQEIMLFDCGANDGLCLEDDWQVLRAPLVRRPPTDEERRALRHVHKNLQGASVARATQLLQSTLLQREEHAVWVAWSATHRCALAFRDPLGRVPLYLYEMNGGYLLTNTRRALEPWTLHEPIASQEVLTSLLVQGTTPTSAHGLLQNLTRVAPGTTATIRPDHAPQHSRWWQWRDPSFQKIQIEEAAEHYRTLLRQSVDRTLSESTLAVELSGGMDSTTVLAAARDVRPDLPVHAINFATHDQDEDRVLARALCQEWGIAFHPLSPSTPITNTYPDPATPDSAAQTVEYLTALGRPVDVLSGHGGDSLFRVQRLSIDRIRRELSPMQWVQLTRAHRRIHGQLPPLFLRERSGVQQRRIPLAEYLLPWVSPDLAAQIQAFTRTRIVEVGATSTIKNMTYSPRWSSILEMGDPGYHGARVQYQFPLFDLELMRFVAQIPPVPWRYDKHLARVAWQNRLPDAIITRRKTVYRPQALDAANTPSETPLDVESTPDWVRADALKRWVSASNSFPGWTFSSAHAILSLLQWAGPKSTARLTIPTNVVR